MGWRRLHRCTIVPLIRRPQSDWRFSAGSVSDRMGSGRLRFSLERVRCPLLLAAIGMTLLLLGCGERIGGGVMAAQQPTSPLVIDLPALYVDYNADGTAYIGSVPAATLGDSLGVDLSPLDREPVQIQRIVEANIQHIQITTVPNQLRILINGRVAPSLTWAPDELAQAGAKMARFKPSLAPLEPLLPIASTWGGGLVLRFPLAAGAIPLPLEAQANDERAAQADVMAYLAAIGGTPPQLTIDVTYAPDGTWRVDGLDAAAWGESVPLPWERLNLDGAQIDTLRAGGVSELVVASNQDGIFLQVNGKALPHLSWADGALQNIVILAADGGLFRELLGDTPTAYSLAATIERLLPMLQLTEVTLRVHFPTDP